MSTWAAGVAGVSNGRILSAKGVVVNPILGSSHPHSGVAASIRAASRRASGFGPQVIEKLALGNSWRDLCRIARLGEERRATRNVHQAPGVGASRRALAVACIAQLASLDATFVRCAVRLHSLAWVLQVQSYAYRGGQIN